MNRFLKLLTLFLVLIMLVQSTVISVFAVTSTNVDTGTYQAAGQPSEYSSQYNSGQRDVIATTLNGTSANAYYTGSYEYDVLSEKSDTEIFNALQSLMRSTHSYKTTYNECHTLAHRSDCENENGSSKKLSLIYTSYTATQSQWNGWNREHVWPKSLGGKNDDDRGGGADLHHIRPSDAVVNSTRGNKMYGKVTSGTAVYGRTPATDCLGGHYSTYFEPLDNVKGDVARICLYVYVRWNSDWGATSITKVFQNVDVLLEWMELDPVDTWELGRNEVIEDIQGNRNVFIDYPEYAWLLFGREVPSDMVTPSGEAQSNGHHWDNGTITTQPTCTSTGVKTYTCTDSGCGTTKTETVASLGGHSYTEQTISEPTCTAKGETLHTCTRCGSTQTIFKDALDHSWSDWITDVEPTETNTGTKHRNCSTCGTTETGIIPVIGHEHSYTTTVVTKPTCTSKGYTTYTCDCGESYQDNYTTPTNHTYSNGLCTGCGATAPTTPLGTKEDFSKIITALATGLLSGETKYQKICEAINIYNSLSQADKDSLSKQYARLIEFASEYNQEAIVTNEDSIAINHVLISFAISTAALPFAALTLLKKKDF